jgi:hypothetical protein
MQRQRYTARIGHGVSIAEDVPYDDLVNRVLEYVLRAAIAKAADQFTWEEEELRRNGLYGIEFAREAKALWWNRSEFQAERDEALREGCNGRFLSSNELDAEFIATLDVDVRERLRRAGYSIPSLLTDMKELYQQIASEASDRTMQAREALVAEILTA